MTTSVDHSIHAFLEQGVAYTFLGYKFQDIAVEVTKWFAQFLQEDLSFRELWCEIDRDGSGDPDDGWLPRRGQERHNAPGHYDVKDVFHYRSYLPSLLETRNAPMGGYKSWLKACDILFNASLSAAGKFVEKLDQELGTNMVKEIVRSMDAGLPTHHTHVLRILHYPRRGNEGKELVGKSHTDRSAFTMPLFSNNSALEGWIDQAMPQVIHPHWGHAAIFAGDKAAVISEEKIQPLIHRVRNKGSRSLRSSVTCFIHAPVDVAQLEKTAAE